jgi:3-oxoacyl-[acyl-carrier-protein] synthase-1
MEMALADANISADKVDYINAHATGTIQGDLAEVNAFKRAFGTRIPAFSSTKSMTGHAMGGAGAQEVLFCIAMLERGFLAPSINADHLDAAFQGLPIIRQTLDSQARIALSTSFGFGGTNATLVLRRLDRG